MAELLLLAESRVLVFGKSLGESTGVMDILVSGLSVARLSMTCAKTKSFTTGNAIAGSVVPLFVDVVGCMVKVLQQQWTHKLPWSLVFQRSDENRLQ